jgi:hypothetical protein
MNDNVIKISSTGSPVEGSVIGNNIYNWLIILQRFLKKYKASGLFGLGRAAVRLLPHRGNSSALERSGIYCCLWIIIVYVGSR